MRHSLFRILNPTASLFDKLIILRILLIALASIAGILSQPEAAYWFTLTIYLISSLLLHYRVTPSAPMLMASLLVDLGALSYLLLLNNGVLSGWVSLLLFPALVGALALPRLWAWAVAASSIIAYGCLMLLYLQQVARHKAHIDHPAMDMSDHLMGMLVTFIVSVSLLTVFINNQAKLLKLQQQQLNKLEDQKWREHHILALATLGANTTHKMATPLSSAIMLLDELEENSALITPDTSDDLKKIKHQLHLCSNALSSLVDQARSFDPDLSQNKIISTWLKKLSRDWWSSHNEIEMQIEIEPALSDKLIAVNSNLDFAITNLLDNAAKACNDSSHGRIQIHAFQKENGLYVRVDDNGEGLDDDIQAALGRGFVPSKHGLGMGVTLAQSAIEQVGGSIKMENKAIGVSTLVHIPFNLEPSQG